MSYILDYGLDSPSRGLLILITSLFDRNKKKEMDILHIQKIIRYFEYLSDKKDIDYSNFKKGGVSYEISENIETLLENGLVDKDKTKYRLTEEGECAAEQLKKEYDEEELQKLSYAKFLLNDLTDDELMFFMYMVLPETQKYSTEFKSLYDRRTGLTKSLFLKGRINSDTAAKWLGISVKQFMSTLRSSD